MNLLNKEITLSVLLIVLSVTSFRANSQSVQRITPIPTENTLMCISKIPGNDKLMAVGEHTTVLLSEDNGDNWSQLFNDEMFYYRTAKSIFFLDQNTGFILVDDGIYKTVGGDWNFTLISGNKNLCQVIFVSPTNGFCIGEQGALYKTINGGESWFEVETGLSIDFTSISFSSESIGYIVGTSTGQSLKTIDGGETWSITSFFPSYTNSGLRNIVFTDETTGYLTMNDLSGLSSDYGRIFKTTDAGESWQEVFSIEGYHPVSMAFFNESNGSVAFKNDQNLVKVFYINDNNNLWTESDLPDITRNSINTICYLNQTSALMGGYAGQIYKTTDSGQTWTVDYERLFYGYISNFQFTDDTTGYLKIWNNFELKNELFKTTDGGENWEVKSNVLVQFVDFINSDTGFACHFDNNYQIDVYKTTDGGENWDNISDITCGCQSVVDFKFYDDMNGLITTIMGPFLKTSDGGINWYVVGDNSNPGWFITYKNANEVFLGGSDGNGTTRIKKSNDGGNTWETYDIGNYGAGCKIVFTDTLTAYFPVSSSVILKSVNGGESWYEVPIEDPDNGGVYIISFLTLETGYATGYGKLFRTTDAGESWQIIEEYPHIPMFTSGLIFFNENNGYMTGGNGVMLKLNNNGFVFNPPLNFELTTSYINNKTLFSLTWNTPDTSNTSGFTGYNVYRNDTLIENTTMLSYSEEMPYNWGGFDEICYYVTAVYSSPDGESEPTEELCDSFLTGMDNFINIQDDVMVKSYPNPFSDNVYFTFEFYDNKDKGILQIFDNKGNNIQNIKVEGKKKVISFGSLHPGVYFYRVSTTSGMSKVHKIIKL